MKRSLPARKSEKLLIHQGCLQVAGVDEVGRGALAGPVVVAAVVLPDRARLPSIRDSKLLNFAQREMAADQIRMSGAKIGIGWVHAGDIDEVGLIDALRLAALQALAHINSPLSRHAEFISASLNARSDNQELLTGISGRSSDLSLQDDGRERLGVMLDGKHNYLKNDCRSIAIIKGDQTELAIAAASVIAKVARDRWMRQLHIQMPHYGFDRNVGYGTSAHLAALSAHGPSQWHRHSFAPVSLLSSRASSRDLSKHSSEGSFDKLRMTIAGES